MTINGATLVTGGTYAAPTGGSSDTLSATGDANSMVAYFDGDTDFLTQKRLEFTTKRPVPSVNSGTGYTKARRSAFLVVPKELADGTYDNDTVSINTAFSTETTAAEIAEIMLLAAQAAAGTAFSELWERGIPE